MSEKDRHRLKITVTDDVYQDAADMDVAKTEYLRMLIRAGRRQLGFDHHEEAEQPHVKTDDPSRAPDEFRDALGELIVQNLAKDRGTSEAELVDLVVDDLETMVQQELEELSGDKVQYRPSAGGWVKK